MNKKIIGILSLSTLIAACSSAPRNDRERFYQHWKQQGDKVSVLEVRPDGDLIHGSGIVDKHPVDEFYNPQTGQFTANGHINGQIADDSAPNQDYASMLGDLAKASTKALADSDRVAVLDFPDEKGKDTALSGDIAEKIESSLVNSGRTVVDRAKLEKIMTENQMQQKDGALFDASTLARLGKLVGANFVIYGKYVMVPDQSLNVSAKVISVETSRVQGSNSTSIPMTGGGAQNRDWIANLLKM